VHEILVLCEGHTEREFCRAIIAPAIAHFGIALAGTIVGKPGRKRGGIRPWPTYRSELVRLAKERRDRHVAVLVDYYAMPDSWPGRAAPAAPVEQRGPRIEAALAADLRDDLGDRFHPCVQVHEFESLLFVSPRVTAAQISSADDGAAPGLTAKMEGIRAACGPTVEHIDDSPDTAPSKRLIGIMPGYDKVAWSIPALAGVEISLLRRECPWLGRWLLRLESVGSGPDG